MVTKLMTAQDIETFIAGETGQLLAIELEMHQCSIRDCCQIIQWKERINGIRRRIRAIVADYTDND